MNKVMLMGRLTRDPMIRHAQSGAKVASYSLAVGRAYKGTDGTTADFPRCVCIFPKVAEFAEQHLRKGLKVIVVGRIQTGSYTNKDGQKVYTTDVIVVRNGVRDPDARPKPAPKNEPNVITLLSPTTFDFSGLKFTKMK